MNKEIQPVFVVRLKKKGLKPYTWEFKNMSLNKVKKLISDYVKSGFHDSFWTICESGIEIKRFKYLQN